MMVTDPPPISPVKVVPSKLPPPVVSATDPVGPKWGPTPNMANIVGSTNVTWKDARNDPAPFGSWLTNVLLVSVSPATIVMPIEFWTITLLVPPGLKMPMSSIGVAKKELADPVFALTNFPTMGKKIPLVESETKLSGAGPDVRPAEVAVTVFGPPKIKLKLI